MLPRRSDSRCLQSRQLLSDALETGHEQHALGHRCPAFRLVCRCARPIGGATKDYIIQSAQSLCGNGGCDYAIVDGATGKSLGTVFGGTLVVGGAAAHSFPAIETVSHLSAESVTDATYSFDGSCYVESSTRVVSGASLDSLDSRLAKLPRFRP